jgi:hypothetical protein
MRRLAPALAFLLLTASPAAAYLVEVTTSVAVFACSSPIRTASAPSTSSTRRPTRPTDTTELRI